MAIITAKLKLYPDAAQAAALRATQFAYRDALNYTSAYAFAHDKLSSLTKLHHGVYYDIRKRFGLLGQMACAVCRQVAGTYKAIWTKLQQNAAHRKAGLTKKRYRGFDQAPKYVAPTVSYSNQEFRFKTGQQVSISTLQGRVVVPYAGYAKHLALIQDGARIGGARLWYDPGHKTFYLLVSLELPVPAPDPARQATVVGVDVGTRYLAVTSTLDGRSSFYSGKAVRDRAEHYTRVRKRLQHKDTRSAIRRLRRIQQRERRFRLEVSHRITRRIVTTHPQALIGLEDLTAVRSRTQRGHSRHHSRRQRRANRWQAQWAFAQLQALLAYKAALAGSVAIRVDAAYTSQQCIRCGHTARGNRPSGGLRFVCEECGYQLHADLIGARNLALRTGLVRQDWISTGCLSTSPDGSGDEAKAARRQRYAELRWSLDSSFQRLAGNG